MPEVGTKPAIFGEKLAAAWKNASVAHPKVNDVAELGRLYHANGYVRQADECWRWLHAVQPDDPHWTYYLADTRRTEGDYEADARLLQETIKQDPSYAPAWLQLADLDFKTGRFAEAEQAYRRRLALLPNDKYAQLGLVRITLQAGDAAGAERQVVALLETAADFQPALNLYAEMLANRGDRAAAARQRLRAAESTRFRQAPDPWMEAMHDSCYDPKLLAVLGTIDYQTAFGDKGVAFMVRATQLAPTDAEVSNLLGELYLKLGEPEKARSFLQQAITLVNPGDVMLYVNLCEAYRMLHRAPEALEVANRGAISFPNAYQLQNELGAILGDLGRLGESAAAYRQAIARAPADPDSNFSLGVTLMALGQKDEGIAAVKHSLTLNPSYPRALAVLGRYELEAGRLDEAEKYIRLVYETHPEQLLVRQLMAKWDLTSGLAATNRKDAAAAEKYFREGMEADPNFPELSINLGMLYLMQRRPADAIGPFESYHKLRPNDPQSSLFLGEVYAQTGRVEAARRILREGAEIADRSGNAETAGYCREILNQISAPGR